MNTKKILSMTLAVLTVIFCFALSACQADGTLENAVYVTIADGELVLTQAAVSLSDTDGDGALTVSDALYLAHEAYYKGGAAAGYDWAESEYGLSLTCLWGNTSGAYGYYVNDASAMSLKDEIGVGDYINAYVYTDMVTWSDTYGCFDVKTAECGKGESVTLTLRMASFDENWNPVSLPVSGAAVTVNGEATELVTDADGRVSITLDKKGSYVISANSDTLTLVPPVCTVTVK